MIPDKPGVYESLSFADYLAIKLVEGEPVYNHSDFITIYESGRGYIDREEKDTVAMRIGRAGHEWIRGKKYFDELYAHYAQGVRRGKVFEAFCAMNEGKEILNDTEHEGAIGAAELIIEDSKASQLLKQNPMQEVVLIWRCKYTGVMCKARIDLVSRCFQAAADWKIWSSLDYNIWKRKLPSQGAFYLSGCEAHKEQLGAISSFTFFVATYKRPRDLDHFVLSSEQLRLGTAQFIRCINRVEEARESGVYLTRADERGCDIVPRENNDWDIRDIQRVCKNELEHLEKYEREKNS